MIETETLTSQAKHFESSWFNTNYKAIRFAAKDEEIVSSVTQITSLILRMNVPAISGFPFYFRKVNIYGHSSSINCVISPFQYPPIKR